MYVNIDLLRRKLFSNDLEKAKVVSIPKQEKDPSSFKIVVMSTQGKIYERVLLNRPLKNSLPTIWSQKNILALWQVDLLVRLKEYTTSEFERKTYDSTWDT